MPEHTLNLQINRQAIMERLTTLQSHLGSSEKNILQILREKYPMDRREMRNLLYGQKYAKIVDECFDVIVQNRHIFEHADVEDFDRPQERERAVKMMLTYHKLRPFQAPRYLQDPHALSVTAHALHTFDPGLSVKTDISIFLYGKTVLSFGNKKSSLHKQLLEDCLSLKDIGCFGLTQLGHGSNVKGIQTEAIYDHSKRQFIMNSPMKSSMKFWIGAAAQLANNAVIWAQLVIDGKKHGPHPFVVPVRNKQTMDLLPGVTIGDCGHKNGCNNIDNGYILLDHVRIPKEYALDGISGVDDQGRFWSIVENPDKRFGMYMNPLSAGRSFVAANSALSSLNALTVAVRYTCQRRQFTGPKEKQETLILDYPLSQYRLMPLLAKAFVYSFGGVNILHQYDKYMHELTDPKNKIVNQMHAISGIAKAQSSWFTLQAIAESRELLGGHGYSSYSRLGRLYNDNDIHTTWEGDNHMLMQQTTKYILKSASKIQREKLFSKSILHFLKDDITIDQEITPEQLTDLSFLEKVLKERIIRMVQHTMSFMMQMKGEGKDQMDIWNEAQPFYGKKLAFAFGDLYYFDILSKKIAEMSSTLREVAEQSLRLWMLDTLEKDRWGTVENRKLIQAKIIELCEWFTPRAVSITDIMAPPSEVIGSPFADENGDGMKKYLNLLFTGKKTFQRVDWYEMIIEAKKKNEELSK